LKPPKEVQESNLNQLDSKMVTGLQSVLKMSKFSPENKPLEDLTLLFLMEEHIKFS